MCMIWPVMACVIFFSLDICGLQRLRNRRRHGFALLRFGYNFAHRVCCVVCSIADRDYKNVIFFMRFSTLLRSSESRLVYGIIRRRDSITAATPTLAGLKSTVYLMLGLGVYVPRYLDDAYGT